MFARLGLPAPAWVPATTAEFFDARMRRFEISSKEPYAWFVTRGPGEGTLDTTLLAGALAAGAEVRFRSRLEPSAADLVATGPQTPDGLARETAFETDGTTRVRVLFDPSVAPGGYAYLFTVGGRGTFGCAIVRDLGGIDRYFEKAKEKLLSVDDVPMEARARRLLLHELRPRPRAAPRRAAGGGGGGGVPGLPLRPRDALRDLLRRPRGRGAPHGRATSPRSRASGSGGGSASRS